MYYVCIIQARPDEILPTLNVAMLSKVTNIQAFN